MSCSSESFPFSLILLLGEMSILRLVVTLVLDLISRCFQSVGTMLIWREVLIVVLDLLQQLSVEMGALVSL